MNDKNVSVIIPTYNRGRLIKKSIESILSQSYINLEVIVIDDFSTDETEHIIKSINDNRIIYHKLPMNKGANYARNIGIQLARFDIIAFQDSDDIWHENKLETQLKILVKNNVDIVSCSYNQFINNKFVKIIPSKRFKVRGLVNFNDLLCGNFISTQTVIGYRKVFLDSEFDNELPRLQDWDLFLRLSKKYLIYFSSIPLVDVYVQKDSISTNPSKMLTALSMIHTKFEDDFTKDSKAFSLLYCNYYLHSFKVNRNGDNRYIKKAFKLHKNLKVLILFILDFLKLSKVLLK